MTEIYNSYRNEIARLMVYVQEAHLTDGWQLDGHRKSPSPSTAPSQVTDSR